MTTDIQKAFEEVLTTLDYVPHTKIKGLWYKLVEKEKYGVTVEADTAEVFRFDKLEHILDPDDPVNKKTINALETAKASFRSKPKKKAPATKKEEVIVCESCETEIPLSETVPVGVPTAHMVCKKCSEEIASGEINVDDWFPVQEQVDDSIATTGVQPIPASQSLSTIVYEDDTPPNTTLDMDTIKKYICPTATDKEAFTFLQLCKARDLNPFTKEAYLIKYKTGPATIVVGKDAFTRRAESNPNFDGFEAGIIVSITDKEGNFIIIDDDRQGTFYHDGEKLIGGWAKVYRKDHKYPVTARVSMKEYNTGKSSWVKIPATMIRKVALVQALRESFPSDLGGCYDSSEMGTEI